MKHKHHELIKLWADGAEIEVHCASGTWISIEPDWKVDSAYRVKPVAKPFNHIDNMEPYYAINVSGNVIETTYSNHILDNNKLSVANYYHTEEAAQKAAAHWKSSNWFVHKALEFQGACCELTHAVVYNKEEGKWHMDSVDSMAPTDILMSNHRANKFLEWLEEFAPNGELL